MMYNLRENTQRTFQVGSRYPMVTDGCWYCLISPYIREISWIGLVEIEKWLLPKSRTEWLVWWTKLLQNLIKMNFADVRSFSAQLILSLHTPDLKFKLKMFVLTLLSFINDVILEASWINSANSCYRSKGNLCQIYSPWHCCIKCFKNSTGMIRCWQVAFFR
jgi:hypothetical protein